jgi:hypothetical protein
MFKLLKRFHAQNSLIKYQQTIYLYKTKLKLFLYTYIMSIWYFFLLYTSIVLCKASILFIPRQRKSVNQRRTDNIMAKTLGQWQSMIYKTLHRKLKIEQHNPHKKGGAPEVYAVPAPLVKRGRQFIITLLLINLHKGKCLTEHLYFYQILTALN